MMTEDDYSSDSDWGDSITEKWRRDLELWSKEGKSDTNKKSSTHQQKTNIYPSSVEQREHLAQAVPSTSQIQNVKSTIQKVEPNDRTNEGEDGEIDVVGLDDEKQGDDNAGVTASMPFLQSERQSLCSSQTLRSCDLRMKGLKDRKKNKKKSENKRLRRSKRLRLFHGQIDVGEESSSNKVKKANRKAEINKHTSRLNSVKRSSMSSLKQDSNLIKEIQGLRSELGEMYDTVEQLERRVNHLEHEKDKCVLRMAVVTLRGELLERDISELKPKVHMGATDEGGTGTASVERGSSAVGVSHYQFPRIRDDDDRILDDLIGINHALAPATDPPTSSVGQSQSKSNGNLPAAQDKSTTTLEWYKREKNYKCFFCEYSFFQKALLIRHLSSGHRHLKRKQEKPCTSVKQKMLHANWKKNYYCCFCGEPFQNNVETRDHITREHKDKFLKK